MSSPPCLCLLLFSYGHIIGIRTHPDNQGLSLHLEILNLITSARTLFSNKVTYTGSEWTNLLGVIIQPTRDTSVSESKSGTGSVSKTDSVEDFIQFAVCPHLKNIFFKTYEGY